MKGINILDELVVAKKKANNQEEILAAFTDILHKDAAETELILKQIFGSSGDVNHLNIAALHTENIYSLDEIKEICVAYRLRFLSTKYYKGEIPNEALVKIKHLQKDHSTSLTGFKMIAPAPMFRLQERDKDPLLFANLGNGYYYLIHKWGTDMHPLRKFLVYPFRSFQSLITSVLVLAFSIAALVPSSVMMGPKDTYSLNIRVIFFFYLFLAFCSITVLYGFSRVKNFNSILWNSKYFD